MPCHQFWLGSWYCPCLLHFVTFNVVRNEQNKKVCLFWKVKVKQKSVIWKCNTKKIKGKLTSIYEFVVPDLFFSFFFVPWIIHKMTQSQIKKSSYKVCNSIACKVVFYCFLLFLINFYITRENNKLFSCAFFIYAKRKYRIFMAYILRK